MQDQVFIQHRFTKTDGKGISFTDALVMPLEQYEKLTPEEIESQKEERFTNWKDAIANPPQEPVLSKAEQLAAIDQDLANIEEQKIQLLSLKFDVSKGGK